MQEEVRYAQELLELIEFYSEPDDDKNGGKPVVETALPDALQANLVALTAWLAHYVETRLHHLPGLCWERGQLEQNADDQDDLERELEELEQAKQNAGGTGNRSAQEIHHSVERARGSVAAHVDVNEEKDQQHDAATEPPRTPTQKELQDAARDTFMLPAAGTVLRILGQAT